MGCKLIICCLFIFFMHVIFWDIFETTKKLSSLLVVSCFLKFLKNNNFYEFFVSFSLFSHFLLCSCVCLEIADQTCQSKLPLT